MAKVFSCELYETSKDTFFTEHFRAIASGSGSLVFLFPWQLFLYKKIQDQKYMVQIILKERTAHLASYTFLQEILINIKTRQSYSSINHQEHFFHRTLITSYFCPANIAKCLRTSFLQNTSRSSRLQMFFKIGVLKSFVNFTGKRLCWNLFLKNLQAEGLQLHKKRLQHRCFPAKFAKF